MRSIHTNLSVALTPSNSCMSAMIVRNKQQSGMILHEVYHGTSRSRPATRPHLIMALLCVMSTSPSTMRGPAGTVAGGLDTSMHLRAAASSSGTTRCQLTLSKGVGCPVRLHGLEVDIHHLERDILGRADQLDHFSAAPVAAGGNCSRPAVGYTVAAGDDLLPLYLC